MKFLIAFFLIGILGYLPLYAQNSSIKVNSEYVNPADTVTPHKVKYDPEFFLLGTLFETTLAHEGRYTYMDGEKVVDNYFPQEKPLAEYISTYIQEVFKNAVEVEFSESNHCVIYSNTLSKRLDSFYDKNGQLIDSIFKTNEQICSFLAGIFYRYGFKIDSLIYQIHPSRLHKRLLSVILLVKLGCKNVLYKKTNSIYFTPTKELKNYLYTIENENAILNKYQMDCFYNMLKESYPKEKFEKDIIEGRKKEVEILRLIFK